MNRNSITRRITGAVVAAALSLSGLAVAGGLVAHDVPEQSEEVAGATWSFVFPGGDDDKGGPVGTHGATWS